MTELINLEFIKPNPFRNLSVKPYDETHIKNLAQSISLNGFTGSLPARQIDDQTYQIAYGHNRIQALRSLGIQQVPLDINSYTDNEMVSILVSENALQSNTFLSTLDSVQATILSLLSERDDLPIRLINQINSGNGIGHVAITTAQPSLKEKPVKICLSVFRETNLEKTFFPVELQQLYEKIPTTTIEAITMFSRPDHISAWLSGFKRYGTSIKLPISKHKAVAEEMLKMYGQKITTSKIIRYIRELAGIETNAGMNTNNNASETETDKTEVKQTLEKLYKEVETFFNNHKEVLLNQSFILEKTKTDFPHVSRVFPLFAILPEILENFFASYYSNTKTEETNETNIRPELNISFLALPESNNNNADFIETEVENYA